jgi:bifunctional enzyme CysN/CysC
MITGANQAEAAILLLDAKEGIKENSKRHAYMLSMLGIDEVLVAINKMDLKDYDEAAYNKLKKEYSRFLSQINIHPHFFIPVSAKKGDNVVSPSENMEWYKGDTFLSLLDKLEKKKPQEAKPLRMPIQGIYKFTKDGDDRRLIAGRIESGSIKKGDEIVILPSFKHSRVKSVEEFNNPREKAIAGESIALTLEDEFYLNRGEVICSSPPLPFVSHQIKANIFWMGNKNLVKNKEYLLKIGTQKLRARIKDIINVLDASSLEKTKREEVERHEVAECIIECQEPIVFDLFKDIKEMGRFVLVEGYDIKGGGIITSKVSDKTNGAYEEVAKRESKWDKGAVSLQERAMKNAQKPFVLLITGPSHIDKKEVAKKLERKLFDQGRNPYFLGIRNILRGLDFDIDKTNKKEHIRRFAEVANLLKDAGLLVILTASDLSKEEIDYLKTIIGEDSFAVAGFDNQDYYDLTLKETTSNISDLLAFLGFKKIIFN